MHIDWFTLGAQAFNFILLAVLLWFVLYRPVRDAVDRREEEIATRVEEARKERQEAEDLLEEHQRKEKEMEERRDALLQEAEKEAEKRRKELRGEVREEMETLREEWKESLRRKQDAFLAELSERARDEIFGAIRGGLAELVRATPAEAFLEAFLHRAEIMDEEDQEAFGRALAGERKKGRIRTALELPSDAVDRIEDLAEGWLPEEERDGQVELEVEREEDGPRGIELWAGDRKLGLSVETYVQSLREEVQRILASEAGDPAAGETAEGEDE